MTQWQSDSSCGPNECVFYVHYVSICQFTMIVYELVMCTLVTFMGISIRCESMENSMKNHSLPDIRARPMYFSRFLDENIRVNCPANRMLIQRRKRFVTAKLMKSNRRDCWSALPQPSQNRFVVTPRIFDRIELQFLFNFILFFRPEQGTSMRNHFWFVKIVINKKKLSAYKCWWGERERKFDKLS